MKQPEIRDAARICDDGFAVQDQVGRRKVGEGIGDRLEAQRPVVSRPGVDGSPSVLQVRLCAIAVELDPMDPAHAGRSLATQRRMTRLDETGERRGLRAGQHACVKRADESCAAVRS